MIRMRFGALDSIHHIAYNKLESKLPDTLHCTLPSTLLIALDYTLPACLTVCSQFLSMAHSQSVWLTLSSELSRRYQVHSRACSQRLFQLHSIAHSQPAWLYTPKYTPGHALMDTPNCTRWPTPSLTVCSQVSSQDALEHTPEHALNSQLHSMTHSQPAWLYTPK